MDTFGMLSLITAITPSANQHQPLRPSVSSPAIVSHTRTMIRRYLFGLHEKTKRSLAEEAECGDEISVAAWIHEGVNPDELDTYGYTPLLNAACTGRLNAVTQLVKNGAEINKKGPFGFTPLHAAAQNGFRDVVQYLLEHGAEINGQNDDNDTALHLALSTQQIEIVYFLLRHGSNVFIKGFNGKDCVETAFEYRMEKIGEYMKQYGLCMKQHLEVSN